MRQAANFFRRIFDVLGAGCGVGTLDFVQVPRGVPHVRAARTLRMVRGAQVSAW